MTRLSRTAGAIRQVLATTASPSPYLSSSSGRRGGCTAFQQQQHHRLSPFVSPFSRWSSGSSSAEVHARDQEEEEGWETVVGLELHVQVAADTKLFSGCVTRVCGARSGCCALSLRTSTSSMRTIQNVLFLCYFFGTQVAHLV
jgi:hypothetical protein